LPSANLLPYVDITTTAAQSEFYNTICEYCFDNLLSIDKSINNATSSNNQMQATPQTGKSQITAKSEVSQSTAISDRPKAIPKNSRKHQQAQQQQQQQQAQSVRRKFEINSVNCKLTFFSGFINCREWKKLSTGNTCKQN
jgi:hypothetical protein